MFVLRGLVKGSQFQIPSISTVRFVSSDRWSYRPNDDVPSRWMKLNEKLFEPTKPGEEKRPAFVCNEKRDIWYSHKKLYIVACFVRGLSVDEALKQLNFVKIRGAKFVKETILEAQEMAVKEHQVEFKSNLWVAESIVEKAQPLVATRRHRGGRMGKLTLVHCNYLVRLEEGKPPEHYYYHKRPKSGQELLDEWRSDLYKRSIPRSL